MNGSPQEEARKALGAALRYLGRRDRTRQEVKVYLRKKGFSGQAAKEAMEKLEGWGYLDDRRVALNWARTKMQDCLWGRARIVAALERRGVERQILEELLPALDQELPEGDLALRAARKYIRTHPGGGPALGCRLAAYLSRRGFPFATIRRLLLEELGEDLGPGGSGRVVSSRKNLQGDHC